MCRIYRVYSVQKMITIELMGGLGNQLFQIFAMLGHALEYDLRFGFLDMPIRAGHRKIVYWDAFLRSLKQYVQKPPRKVQVTQLYREPYFHYAKIPRDNGSPLYYLHGYFQSYKYFDKHREKILNMISLQEHQNGMMDIISTEDRMRLLNKKTISLHFRLGDYKQLQQHHPILEVEYYARSLQQFCISQNMEPQAEFSKGSTNEWTIVYFHEENDHAAVSRSIGILRERFPCFEFRRMEYVREDWQQMVLMSMCKHHIIANSSFSWFGAYMAEETEDHQVYYPQVWFGPAQGEKKMDDLCPEKWIKV